MRTRVGRMPYLNSDVFYRDLPEDRFELLLLPPRRMALAIERGEIDAGPIPIAEVFRLEDLVEPLGDLCVATRDAAASVLLFSRRPAEELGGATVAVTDQTATSVQLLRVLLAERWQVAPPVLAGPDADGDAALLIGDDALRASKGLNGYERIYDLGHEWRNLTGLPMVFAPWVVRRTVDRDAADELLRALEKSLHRGICEIGRIAAERRDVGLTASEVVEYLSCFIYRMGPDERRAIETFHQAIGRLPDWRPDPPHDTDAGAAVC